MNESLINVIFEACISAVIIPERLVMEQALLVAILHGNVGTEVGKYITVLKSRAFSSTCVHL